jgi:hypothetical protein
VREVTCLMASIRHTCGSDTAAGGINGHKTSVQAELISKLTNLYFNECFTLRSSQSVSRSRGLVSQPFHTDVRGRLIANGVMTDRWSWDRHTVIKFISLFVLFLVRLFSTSLSPFYRSRFHLFTACFFLLPFQILLFFSLHIFCRTSVSVFSSPIHFTVCCQK